MKKILLIHNTYREIGGEDVAVKNEIQFLKSFYNVETLIFNNEIQNPLLQFLYFLLNRNLESEKKDIMDGYLYADSEEVAIALDEKFKEIIKDTFVVNYSFSFVEDEFDLDFRKKLGYSVWANARIPTGMLYYLKRLPNFKVLSPEEEKQAKIDALKKQLEELNAT